MANAIKQISVQKGHDVTRYALTSFGGAGGQHACAVADALGIGTVLVPPDGRACCRRYGIGLADTTAMREQSVEDARCRGAASSLRRDWPTTCEQAARAELRDAGRATPTRIASHPARASALRRHRHRTASRARPNPPR